MASRNFLVSTLASMTILAIIQGSMIPVMGRWDIQSANKALGEGSEVSQGGRSTTTKPAISIGSEADYSEGSWNISNNLPGPVAMCCHSQTKDVPPSTVQPQASLSDHFPVISGWTNQWNCNFRWESSTGLLTQSFEVWANADSSTPYLSTCNDCQWKVEQDGFYFQGSDGAFSLEWQWAP